MGESDPLEPGGPASPGEAARVPVVGIGASAGGLEALERLFAHLPHDTGMAFVVVQHLSPDHKSLMVELLSKHARMPVRSAEDDVVVEPDTVYLLPPRKTVTIRGGQLKLTERSAGHVVPLPVDVFFSSLADELGEQATAVVLSGTGSDGMRGVRDIKAAGGTVLAQDEGSAKFDGMPRAAVSTGIVDAILPPERIAAHIAQLSRRRSQPVLDPGTADVADAYPRIIAALHSQTGVDFTHYKATSVLRRIERRMRMGEVGTLADYARLLESSPREVATLHRDLLIGVTRFFRDPAAFEAIRARVVPELLARTRWDQQVRVWVAGCSTGEEAYGLGILLLEAMEAAGRRFPIKIFGTDVDRESLEVASAGLYPEAIAADVSPERLARHFVRRADGYAVGRDLRSLVLFAAHDLVKDPPFTRMDLVSCRNLLIYLEPVLQRKVLSLFHYSLNQGGYLMLGPSEVLGDTADRFQVVDAKWKIFRGVGHSRVSLGDSLAFGSSAERRRLPLAVESAGDAEVSDAATRWLLARCAPTALLVTPAGVLVHAYGDPERFLSVPAGRASLSVADMLARPLSGTVSTAVHQAHTQHREVQFDGVRSSEEPAAPVLRVRAVPLALGRSERPHVFVLLEDERPGTPLPPGEPLDVSSQRHISDLQGQIQTMKENLQATIEELETSNEELQSTNEELLSSNEELQSTNEELQSVNEELHTVNQEYQAKIQELSDLNVDLDNLLRGTEIGTLFLDGALAIRRFTPAVGSLVRVMPQDLGRPVDHFALNFQLDSFLDDVRAVLETGQPRTQEAAAVDGRRLLVRMLPYVGGTVPQRGVVVTFVDITATTQEKQKLQAVLDSLPEQLAVLDSRGTVVLVNRAWMRFGEANGAGGPGVAGVGADYLATCDRTEGADRETAAAVARGLRDILAGRRSSLRVEYPCHSPTERRWFLLNASPLPPSMGGAVVTHVDVTARMVAEQRIRDAGQGGE